MGLKAQREVEALWCPFCKSDDLHFETTADGHVVECKGCHASGPEAPSQGQAVEAWNVRTYYSGKRKKSETETDES